MFTLFFAFLLLLWSWFRTKYRLRPPRGRVESHVIEGTEDTRLGKAAQELARAHPGESGVFPLPDGRDAFAARVLLADTAERSLDIQYYLWQNDLSGGLLFAALRRAADRGVRVRLLLDDNNTTGMDRVLAELDAHPNIELRLFNPFTFRGWRAVGYLTDFSRLNRRMHNKSFTADNQVTIIGGRNVADEYFEATKETVFVDLDLLALGPVVNDVSRDFDRYWASQSSHAAETILPALAAPATRASDPTDLEENPAAATYLRAVNERPFMRELLELQLPLIWAPTRLVSDDPAKGLGRARDKTFLWARIKTILGSPTRELGLVSPYFVPTTSGVKALTALAKQGVRVRVLTNSLNATDVAAVHAGYAKRRKALLKGGVELYELKRVSSRRSVRDRGLPGSSGSSLHAKTFSVDHTRVFVGSFNFDPRSRKLNTELGFVIDCPTLARMMSDAWTSRLAYDAYEVRLNRLGLLRWVEHHDGKKVVSRKEPSASWQRRLTVFVLSRLPIEWLL